MSGFDLTQSLNLPELSDHMVRLGPALAGALATKNPEFADPVAALLKTKGKRLRSGLVMAIVIGSSKEINESVVTSAAAVELMHIASLIHDDIIDDAKTRHGTPTANAKTGNSRAIILGDFLLAKAYEQAASAGQAIAQTLAEAFTRMCDGQALELADLYNLSRSKVSYLNSIRGKTGALFSAACQSGGLLAGLSQPEIEALSSYGENFGIAFQLIDDVIDFVSTSKLAGKPVGVDVPSGNYTLPVILALRQHPKKYQDLLKGTSLKLANNLVADGFIRQTIEEIKAYNLAASKDLVIFKNQLMNLQSFPETYLNWALENLAATQIS